MNRLANVRIQSAWALVGLVCWLPAAQAQPPEPDEAFAMSFEPRLLPRAPAPVEVSPAEADGRIPAQPGPTADPGAEQERKQLAHRQETILELIGLPSNAELASRHALEPSRDSTRVLMVDTQLDSGHCGFDPRLVRAFDSAGNPLAIPSEGREDCGTPFPAGDQDHGTHVGGLIAATPNSAVNAVLRGVNPRVKLDAYEKPVGEGSLEIRELWLERTSAMLDKALREIPRVINLSMDYEPRGLGSNDPVRGKLKQLKSSSLVVVAAGNERSEHGEACPRYPACFKLPNVLVVGALDLDAEAPAMWAESAAQGSDVGARVHLAAPGLEVPSLARGNTIGWLSGTSQAAPLVSGAASLLYARVLSLKGCEASATRAECRIPPYLIRNRLIYTSDLFPHLHDLMLGGRLNVDRALDVESATFVLKPGAVLKCDDGIRELPDGGTLEGRVAHTASADGSNRSQSFVVLHVSDPEAACGYPCRYISFRHLKRMVYRPGSSAYLLLIGPQGTATELERIEAPLNSRRRRGTPRRWVWLELERPEVPGPARSCGFEMLHIEDYVAAMPLEDL